MNNEKEIFGAFDSELMHQEITIPEGFEATIDGDKIILTRKDSEDERIRKELIGYIVKEVGLYPGEDRKEHKWLRWLEKQGEQKSQRMISAEAKEAMYDKPTDEDMKEALRTEYEKGRADAFAQMQKKWSKEDESIALGIEQIVNCASLLNIAPDKLDKVRNWLKSIKDRIIPQPKQEWSKEDEKIRQNLMSLLSDMRGHRIEESTYQKYYPWLKSLKERYAWKPSDEQMKQLGWVAEQNKDNMIGKELMSLYQDLKKLKE